MLKHPPTAAAECLFKRSIIPASTSTEEQRELNFHPLFTPTFKRQPWPLGSEDLEMVTILLELMSDGMLCLVAAAGAREAVYPRRRHVTTGAFLCAAACDSRTGSCRSQARRPSQGLQEAPAGSGHAGKER